MFMILIILSLFDFYQKGILVFLIPVFLILVWLLIPCLCHFPLYFCIPFCLLISYLSFFYSLSEFQHMSVFWITFSICNSCRSFLSFTACFHPCLSFLNTPRQFFSTVCNLNLVCLLNPCLTLLKFLGKTAHFLLLTFSSNDLYIRVLFILIIWTHAFFWWSVGVTTNQLTYTVVAGLIISWINGYRVGLSACLLSSTLAFFNLLKSLKYIFDGIFQAVEGTAPKCDKTPRGQDTYKSPGANLFTVQCTL